MDLGDSSLRRSLWQIVLAVCLLSTCASASNFQAGDLFLSTHHGEVRRYNGNGQPQQVIRTGHSSQTAFGTAFDSSGNLYVAVGASIERFDNSGNHLGVFTSVASTPDNPQPRISDVAIDSRNYVYASVLGATHNIVQKYTSRGKLVGAARIVPQDEGPMYLDAGRDRIFATPGHTARIAVIGTGNLQSAGLYVIPSAVDHGDLRSLPCGNLVVASASGVYELDDKGYLLRRYVFPGAGAFIGIDKAVESDAFWTVTKSGQVRRFSLRSPNPTAQFEANIPVTALSLYEVTSVPEPATMRLMILVAFAAALGILGPHFFKGVKRTA